MDPTLLTCLACGYAHVDKGSFAVVPHRVHICSHHHCGRRWDAGVAGIGNPLGQDGVTSLLPEPVFDAVHVFHTVADSPESVVTTWATSFLLQYHFINLMAFLQAIVEDDPPRWQGVWQSEPCV